MRWKMMHCHHRHRHHSSFPAPGGGEEAPRSISCFSTLLGRIASIIASAAARGSAVETREGAGGEWECRAPSAGDICEEKHNTTKEGTQSTSATADEKVEDKKEERNLDYNFDNLDISVNILMVLKPSHLGSTS